MREQTERRRDRERRNEMRETGGVEREEKGDRAWAERRQKKREGERKSEREAERGSERKREREREKKRGTKQTDKMDYSSRYKGCL